MIREIARYASIYGNRSRLYKGGYIPYFYYHILIYQFAALFLLVTGQTWLR